MQIKLDEKRSKNGRSISKKVFVSGVKAKRFLSLQADEDSSEIGNTTKMLNYNRWKSVHNAMVDHADNGQARSRKAMVWKSLDTIFKFCGKKQWSANDHISYKRALEDFKNLMLCTWTNQNTTHYMVVLVLPILL